MHSCFRELGLHDEEPLNQHLGAVSTLAGRCIGFPNVLQHKVSGFELADPLKPGHRKILVLFLVDPCKRVLSTSSVPPQQMDWYLQELKFVKRLQEPEMPCDVFEHIMSFVDGPMRRLEAPRRRSTEKS